MSDAETEFFVCVTCAQQTDGMATDGGSENHAGVATCRGQQSAGQCPERFWEQPTKDCLRMMDSVLDELIAGEWQMADVRINKTCEAYGKMKSCMDDLLAKCSQDETRVRDLRRVVDRYEPYSRPCHDETLRHRQRVIDCFRDHIGETRDCVNEFDRSYKSHMVKDDFAALCKDIDAVMGCLQTTKTTVRGECGEEGATVYEMNYILHVVVPTRELVADHCPSLPRSYAQYYNSAPSGAGMIRGDAAAAVLMALVWISS